MNCYNTALGPSHHCQLTQQLHFLPFDLTQQVSCQLSFAPCCRSDILFDILWLPLFVFLWVRALFSYLECFCWQPAGFLLIVSGICRFFWTKCNGWCQQWLNVIMDIYSSNIFKYKLEVLVLNMSISIFLQCNTFTPLHLSEYFMAPLTH